MPIDAPQNMFIVSIPTVLDKSLAPEGKHLVHIYTAGNEPYKLWEGMKRGSQEYKVRGSFGDGKIVGCMNLHYQESSFTPCGLAFQRRCLSLLPRGGGCGWKLQLNTETLMLADLMWFLLAWLDACHCKTTILKLLCDAGVEKGEGRVHVEGFGEDNPGRAATDRSRACGHAPHPRVLQQTI